METAGAHLPSRYDVKRSLLDIPFTWPIQKTKTAFESDSYVSAGRQFVPVRVSGIVVTVDLLPCAIVSCSERLESPSMADLLSIVYSVPSGVSRTSRSTTCANRAAGARTRARIRSRRFIV